MRTLAKYKKALAAAVAGAVVLVASIPTDADPKLIAAGQLVTVLAVLLAPRNAQPVTRADVARKVNYLTEPTRHVRREDRGP